MSTITLGGNAIHTAGELPATGTPAPAYEFVGSDWSTISSAELSGRTVVLNIFPSVDTAVCAMSVRKFNEAASDLSDTTVVCVSADLPPAAARFCGAEGIENVQMGSVFRNSEFGQQFGLTMTDGKLAGLLARAVVVIAPDGTVSYSELVPEIAQEPDYEAALRAIN
jgi:thiol peroxidase